MDKKDIIKAIDAGMEMSFTSQVALRVSQLAGSPNVTVKRIENEISKDPVLAAKILKVVNSGFYGFSKPITTISRAIMILGLNSVKAISVSVWATENVPGDIEGYLDHFYYTGRIAGIIAEKIGYPKPEEAVLIGLLHDIGKIVLYGVFPREFYKIIDECSQNNKMFIDVERSYFDTDHAEIGAYFLEKWRLPDFFVSPIKNHHSIDPSDSLALETSIIHLADMLCRSVNFGTTGDHGVYAVDKSAWQSLNLSDGDLSHIVERIFALKKNNPQ